MASRRASQRHAGIDVLADVRREATLTKKQSIATRIVDRVLDLLRSKKIDAGSFLGTEASVAESFAASRFPVREALSRLEALGIVEIRRGLGGGITVANGNPDHFAELLAIHFLLADISIEELFEARLAIVPKAAEHAARHATPEDVQMLTDHLDRIVTFRHDFDAALDALLDFHLKLVELSKLRTLTALNRTLCLMLRDLHRRYPPPILTTSKDVNSYAGLRNLRSVVAKIGEGDSQGASDVIRLAIMEHKKGVLALAK